MRSEFQFIGPLSYAVGHYAEEPGRSESQRKQRNAAEQRRYQTAISVFVLPLNPLFQVTSLTKHLLIGNRPLSPRRERDSDRKRRVASPNQDLSIHAHLKGVRHENRGLDWLAQPVVTGVAYNADDLQPAITARRQLCEGRRAFQSGAGVASQGVAVGPYCRAMVWLMTASRAPCTVSAWSHKRPCKKRYAQNRKILRLTKFARK